MIFFFKNGTLFKHTENHEEVDTVCLMLAAWGRKDGLRAKGVQEEEKERCCKKHMRDDGNLTRWGP